MVYSYNRFDTLPNINVIHSRLTTTTTATTTTTTATIQATTNPLSSDELTSCLINKQLIKYNNMLVTGDRRLLTSANWHLWHVTLEENRRHDWRSIVYMTWDNIFSLVSPVAAVVVCATNSIGISARVALKWRWDRRKLCVKTRRLVAGNRFSRAMQIDKQPMENKMLSCDASAKFSSLFVFAFVSFSLFLFYFIFIHFYLDG